jgi:hypothetical protein
MSLKFYSHEEEWDSGLEERDEKGRDSRLLQSGRPLTFCFSLSVPTSFCLDDNRRFTEVIRNHNGTGKQPNFGGRGG